MTLSHAARKRSIDTLRKNADDARDAIGDLADALEAGTADAELAASTIEEVTYALVALDDAVTDAIDRDTDRWDALDDLRASMYHTAHAIEIDETDADVISPSVDGCDREALRWATTAAEYLESAREHADGSGR